LQSERRKSEGQRKMKNKNGRDEGEEQGLEGRGCRKGKGFVKSTKL
jgi:hypothetical protein